VGVGDLAYWPPGRAVCIFWGPTPASEGSEPQTASPVNVFGRNIGDAAAFGSVGSGANIRLERARAVQTAASSRLESSDPALRHTEFDPNFDPLSGDDCERWRPKTRSRRRQQAQFLRLGECWRGLANGSARDAGLTLNKVL
jgi:hypothetical protein